MRRSINISNNDLSDISHDAVIVALDSSTDLTFDSNRIRNVGGRALVVLQPEDVRQAVESLSSDERAVVQDALKRCEQDKGRIISILLAIPAVASKLSTVLGAGVDAIELYERLRNLFK